MGEFMVDYDVVEVKGAILFDRRMQRGMAEANHVFDAAHLLESIDGDEELLRELIDLFIADAPVQLDHYKRALVNGDVKTAERAAHTLKGASSNLSANRVRDVAAAAEMLCREGKQSEAEQHEAELDLAVSETIAVMRSFGT